MRTILNILLLIITLLFIFSFFISNEYRVKQTIEIKSTSDSVFSYINNLKNWEKWAVWNQVKNPSLSINYDNKTEGVGAKLNWFEKDIKVRNIEITYSVPYEYVKYNMGFDYDHLDLTGSFIIKNNINSTTINWIKVCNVGSNPLSKYFAYFSFEKFIGKEMEISLKRLKKYLESNFQ